MRIARNLEQLDTPHFKKFRELQEARWSGENRVPHRIFCYAPAGRQVIFLCGCTRYDPPNAYDTAVRRRQEIRDGRASTREFDF